MHKVYFSLGSNLGRKEQYIEEALKNIEMRIGKIISKSAFYYSKPWGFESDNDFVNICAVFETELTPNEVLLTTKDIEKYIGRESKTSLEYQDRVIDIDIILFDNDIINTEELIVPHKFMHLRDFVIKPLNEIASDYIHPVFNKTIKELASEIK